MLVSTYTSVAPGLNIKNKIKQPDLSREARTCVLFNKLANNRDVKWRLLIINMIMIYDLLTVTGRIPTYEQ